MSQVSRRRPPAVLALLGIVLLTVSASSQVPQPNPKVTPQPQPQPQPPGTKIKPSLKPIAETRLLMEGLVNVNYRGLEKLLKAEPASVEAWTFARGQALIIAESSNLLMLRPPKGEAQDIWFDWAMSLRAAATQLAAAAAAKDYAKTKSLFVSLANNCNGCHKAFSVPVQIVPFPPEPGAGKDTE